VAGHSGQFTPCGYLSYYETHCVSGDRTRHTFRLLVRCVESLQAIERRVVFFCHSMQGTLFSPRPTQSEGGFKRRRCQSVRLSVCRQSRICDICIIEKLSNQPAQKFKTMLGPWKLITECSVSQEQLNLHYTFWDNKIGRCTAYAKIINSSVTGTASLYRATNLYCLSYGRTA